MSKDANPGELRTPVYVEAYTDFRNENGHKVKAWFNVFGDKKAINVKWVNLHGTEVWEAMSHNLKDPATLTCRFSPLITETCRILKLSDKSKRDEFMSQGKTAEADAVYFEVISKDNVDEQNEWLELKIQRMVRAK